MPKRINHISDLPKWYHLSKYQEIDKLGCLEWYWQLSARLALHNFVAWAAPESYYNELPTDDFLKRYHETEKELLEHVRNDPILDVNVPAITNKFVGKLFPPPDSGITYVSLLDIDNQLRKLGLIEQDKARRYLHRIDISANTPPFPDLFLDVKKDTFDGILLKVNLDIPERILIENFTALIREAKENHTLYPSEVSRYRKPDFKEWIRIGILPYLDLKIWEIQEEVNIPNRVMADAILFGDDEGEEVVRKTTAKLAEQILDGNLIQVLATLYATEKMNTNVQT